MVTKIEKSNVFKRQTLFTPILERFMSDTEIRKLEKSYEDVCKRRGSNRTRIATAEDIRYYKEFKKGATISGLAEKYGKSYTAMKTCLFIAAIID